MTDPEDAPLRIIGLVASNVKKLRAVSIEPDPHLVVIGGSNGSGKSSLLDSIWWALGGRQAHKDTPRPIRDGETEASVTLDLGELVVERTWKGKDSFLTVRGRDGSKLMSPQALLDALTGEMAFDPLQFANQHPAVQRQTLLSLVELPFDLDTIDAERQAAFDQRTDINRRRRALDARIGSLPLVAVPDDAVSIAEAMEAHRTAAAHNAHNAAVRISFHQATVRNDTAVQRLAEAQAALEAAVTIQAAAGFEWTRQQRVFDALQPDIDMEPLAVAVTEAEHWAEQRALAMRRIDLETEDAELHNEVVELESFMRAIDERKQAGLTSATMPIPGLGVSDVGITYGGLPFGQCSAAEKLRVATAIAMAGNPRIRVMLIHDASLLDDDNFALIAEMAEANSYQVWLERVGDGDPSAIVIEDGQLRP